MFVQRQPVSCSHRAFPVNRNDFFASKTQISTSWRGRNGRLHDFRSPRIQTKPNLTLFQITNFLLQQAQDIFGQVVVLHLRCDLHGRLRWSAWHNSSLIRVTSPLSLYHVLCRSCSDVIGAILKGCGLLRWHHGIHQVTRKHVQSRCFVHVPFRFRLLFNFDSSTPFQRACCPF